MEKKEMRSSEKKYQDNNNWKNEHGQPDLEFLESLAIEETPASLEKIRSIAEDLDVSYGFNTSTKELIDEILASVRSDPTVTS